MEIQNVNSNFVVGGVLNNNSAEFLIEDMFNGINITYEEWIKDNDINEEDYEVLDNYIGDNDTYLIGYKKGKDGLYDIDLSAEYSAIVGETYTQITHSKYISYAIPCSPCFPYQNDLATKGDYATYTLPSDVFGRCEHLEIFELDQK